MPQYPLGSWTHRNPRPRPPGEPRFLVQVANACRVRHQAYSTEQSYVLWVKRFILFHNKRHPQDMEPSELRTHHRLPSRPQA